MTDAVCEQYRKLENTDKQLEKNILSYLMYGLFWKYLKVTLRYYVILPLSTLMASQKIDFVKTQLCAIITLN